MKHSLFQARFRCVTITPFGRDVEPDVNWRKQRSVGSTFTSTVPSCFADASSSTVTMPFSVSTRGATGSTNCRVVVVVRRREAPDAFVMCVTVSW
jgi:hypothetical protein